MFPGLMRKSRMERAGLFSDDPAKSQLNVILN
jgi:hypothetical protein